MVWKKGATFTNTASADITIRESEPAELTQVIWHIIDDGTSVDGQLRFNEDSGSNYGRRRNIDGTSEATEVSQSVIEVHPSNSAVEKFGIASICDVKGKNKLVINHSGEANTAGAANSPRREEDIGKYVPSNSNSDILAVTMFEASGPDIGTGSNMTMFRDTVKLTNLEKSLNGVWKEVGRTTLTVAADSISVTGLPNKRYYMTLGHGIASGNIDNEPTYTFNNDTSTNYAISFSKNDVGNTGTNGSSLNYNLENATTDRFHTSWIANLSGNQKLQLMNTVGEAAVGAGTAPAEGLHSAGYWDNTTDSIDSIQYTHSGSGDFAVGSELVVLGYDENDTHTDNFWELLNETRITTAGDKIDTGVFPARKYLKVHIYSIDSGLINNTITFNDDSGSNYAERRNDNDGTQVADPSNAGLTEIFSCGGFAQPCFSEFFIVNTLADVKLGWGHLTREGTSGAGTEPSRKWGTFKWNNTTAQINQIESDNTDTGNYDVGSFIKVWGHD